MKRETGLNPILVSVAELRALAARVSFSSFLTQIGLTRRPNAPQTDFPGAIKITNVGNFARTRYTIQNVTLPVAVWW